MNKEESKKSKTPHEIVLMEQLAEELEEWARDESAVLSTISDDEALTFFRLSKTDKFYPIREWLEWHNPHVAKQINELFDDIEYLGEVSQETPDSFNVFVATLPVKVLASKLRYIAKMVRDDEKITAAQLRYITKKVREDIVAGKAAGKDAYISFSKAIEFSNGILTRKKLEKAIDKGDPIKVRFHKPSKQRRDVHIQDVLSLIKEVSGDEDIEEKATKMFAQLKEIDKSKRPIMNLD